MPVPNSISISQLNRLVGTPECPTIIDVRLTEDFVDDPRLIAGAIRRGFDDIVTISEEFFNQKIIIYCQKGFKISQGTAALLCNQGVQAEFLEGGHFAWLDSHGPMVIASNIAYATNTTHSRWVTRYRPKIDRIAGPWLIRRFIDPFSEFLFVEPSQVLNVAERFSATAFDVAGVKLSHQGDLCSFDALLSEFGLDHNEALVTLAQVVRAADTNAHHLAPEAAGLLAISNGLSRMYRDDLAMLEAGMLVYDALYRWARDDSYEMHTHSFDIYTQP